MSYKSKKLESLLFNKLNHYCTVWFESKRQGWMFKSSELHPQRLGYNFDQAIMFIKTYDWSWINNYLKNVK